MILKHTSALALGMLADRLIPDPKRNHPVALFGNYATWLEQKLYRDSKVAGAVYVAACTVPPTLATAVVAKKAPQLALIAALWASLGGATLQRTATHMADNLDARDIEGARNWVPWLCSRDPQSLNAAGMARATVESVSENTSDAVVAPIVWSLVGAPGVIAHRCVNTLDAMIGYKSERYGEFGWAAAKLDDLMAWVPARLTALIHTGFAASAGRGEEALRAWANDAPKHPSPNAGPVEATAAAALGVQLGGETQYAHGVEQRPTLGEGISPNTATIRQAVRLSMMVQGVAGGVVAGIGVAGALLWRLRK